MNSIQKNPLFARYVKIDAVEAFIATRKKEILSLSEQEQIEALRNLHTDIEYCCSKVGRQVKDEYNMHRLNTKRLFKLETSEDILIYEAEAIEDLLAERGIGRGRGE